MATHQDVDSGKPGKPFKEQGEKHPVAQPSASYALMAPRWKTIHTVLGGTAAMRAAGRDFLKQHPYEEDPAYQDRLESAVLDNYTRRTLDTLVGKAFRDPPAPGDDVPQAILPILEDVDGEGTGFVTFARSFFRHGVRDAFSFVVVDFTRAAPREDGKPRTLADDARDGVRPIWRRVDACDVLGSPLGIVDGKVAPVAFRYRDDELRLSEDGFTETLVERIKVLRPGAWEVWEKKKASTTSKPKWEKVDEGPSGIPFVPVVAFYTDKTGNCEGMPPLLDLADKNVEHWASSADQRNILTVARFPMLAVSGVQSGDNQAGAGEIVVGPRKLLTTSDPQSKVYFVEHNGAAIDAGKVDLERLEERMASYGAEFLTKKPGTESATGRALDGAEAISSLQAWGLDFKDALERCLQITAVWLKLGDDAGGSIDFEISQDVDMNQPAELTTLDAARDRNDISREAWVEEMKLRSVLREEYDAEEDQEKIDAAPPPPGTGLDGMTGAARPAKVKAKPPAT